MNRRALRSSAFVLSCVFAIAATAQAGPPPIPLPPPILLPLPPPVVILPDTDVFVVPDVAEDLFFSGGWWWRPWKGRWYRSRSYDRGWVHFHGTPSFHRDVPPGWRHDYRARRWGGGAWDHRPIPHARLKRDWSHWRTTGYWRRPENRQHHNHRDGRRIEAHERHDRRELRRDRRDDRQGRREQRHEKRKERRDKKRDKKVERHEKKQEKHEKKEKARRRDR